MPTPINPKDNLNLPPNTGAADTSVPSINNNISMLAYLYDNTASDLHKALASQEILVTDERIKNKVIYLGEIAKTLSLVYQIESMRATPKENSLALPGRNVVAIDPALKKANSRKNFNPNEPQNLGQFPSPGGWTP